MALNLKDQNARGSINIKLLAIEVVAAILLILFIIFGAFFYFDQLEIHSRYRVLSANGGFALLHPVDDHDLDEHLSSKDHIIVRNPWPQTSKSDIVRVEAMGIQDIPYIAEIIKDVP